MQYYEYDGGIAVVLDSKKAFAWDDVDNAWKPAVASEIYGDERAFEVAQVDVEQVLRDHEAKPFTKASSSTNSRWDQIKAIGALLYLFTAFCCLLFVVYMLISSIIVYLQ